MKRKRLNHYPHAVLGILNGYQMYGNLSLFWEKGIGTYEYDLLSDALKFNTEPIATYPIFKVTKDWFDRDLIAQKISREKIEVAQIELEIIKRSEHMSAIRKSYLFGLIKRVVSMPGERDLVGNARVTVKTDEKEYSKQATCVVWE